MRFSKWHALGNSYLRRWSGASSVGRSTPSSRAGSATSATGSARTACSRSLECRRRDGLGRDLESRTARRPSSPATGRGSRRCGSPAAAARTRSRSRSATATIAATVREDGLVETDVGPVAVRETETIDVAGERVELTPVSVGNPHAVVRREPDRDELAAPRPADRDTRALPGAHERAARPRRRPARGHRRRLGARRGGDDAPPARARSRSPRRRSSTAGARARSRVRMPGGELEVALDAENRATLTGPAEEICEGELRERSPRAELRTTS